MANLQNFRNNRHNSSASIGQKVQNLAKIAGADKGIYDTGRTIYTIGQTIAPYVIPLLGAL